MAAVLMGPSMKSGRFNIRQSLFAVLLLLVLLMTSLFLLLSRYAAIREIERTSTAEMDRSRDSYLALESQRQDLLLRQAALLSELPSLKALMTTSDQPTIEDAGRSFWRTSGSDIFALLRPDGTLLAVYSNGARVNAADCAAALSRSREQAARTDLIFAAGRFFQVATQPIYFSGGANRRMLGYVSSGYELNDRLAQVIGRAPAGQIAFATADGVIASTLAGRQGQALKPYLTELLTPEGKIHPFKLLNERYLASSSLLQPAEGANPAVYLLILRSYRETTALIRQLDLGIALLAALLLLIGGALAFFLARTVTRPLEALLRSTRELGRGEVVSSVQPSGPVELRELRDAFEKMHDELLSSQTKLLEGERLATIGRMASSISHDLRHYLSPIYANAEFLASPGHSEAERGELLDEISDAARGMTELLDAMLTFSRTGILLHLAPGSITGVVRRAIGRVQPHPDARGVVIASSNMFELEGSLDGNELQRAVYNLLLNACQAARSSSPPRVSVSVTLETKVTAGDFAAIRIRDNGAGVSPEILNHLFEPFVSEGKQSGMGLGLALVKRIAEAHGGMVGMRRLDLDKLHAAETEFFLLLPYQPFVIEPVPGEMTKRVMP
jgi:signal transduction histidine kinase